MSYTDPGHLTIEADPSDWWQPEPPKQPRWFVPGRNPDHPRIMQAIRDHAAASERVRAGLAAARERGVKLGGWRGGPIVDGALGRDQQRWEADEFASRVRGLIERLQADGMSLRAVAAEMMARGIPSRRGGRWTAQAVKNVLARPGR